MVTGRVRDDRVGDSPTNDVAFGQAAGTKTALLDTGRRLQEGGNTNDPDIIVAMHTPASVAGHDHAMRTNSETHRMA